MASASAQPETGTCGELLFTDMSLVASDGTMVNCHKGVVVRHSLVLRDVILAKLEEPCIIPLPCEDAATVRFLVRLCYDQVVVRATLEGVNQLELMLELDRKYDMPRLKTSANWNFVSILAELAQPERVLVNICCEEVNTSSHSLKQEMNKLCVAILDRPTRLARIHELMTLLLLADKYQLSFFLQPCLEAVASRQVSVVQLILRRAPELKNLSGTSFMELLSGVLNNCSADRR